MESPGIFNVRSSLLGVRKPLTVSKLFIETSDFRQKPIRFGVEDIDAVRLGMNGFNLSLFPLSRTWAIDIRSNHGALIRVRYHSFFGIGTKRKQAAFDALMAVLNETFLYQLCIHYLQLIDTGLAFDLGGALLGADGIRLTDKSGIIPWHRLGIKQYGEYFMLYDIRTDAVYRSFDFYHTWNAVILFYVVELLLRAHVKPGRPVTGN